MSGRPKLFVHCGLHKTASTTIQFELGRHREELAAQGLYLPLKGSRGWGFPPGGAHHNIAFEMSGGPAFKLGYGNSADLREELVRHEGDALISSEEFETLLGFEGGLAPLRTLAAQTGRDLTIVVYLREQSSYFASFFLELMKHARTTPDIPAMVRDIIETGRFFHRDVIVNFDYLAMLKRCDAQDVPIIVRNYHALRGDPLTDLLTALEYSPIAAFSASRRNSGAHPGSLVRYVCRRAEIIEPKRRQALERLDISIAIAPRLTPALMARLEERFGPGNGALRNKWGIDLSIGRPAPAAEGELALDRVFTQVTLAKILDILDQKFPQTPKRLRRRERYAQRIVRVLQRVPPYRQRQERQVGLAAEAMHLELLPLWTGTRNNTLTRGRKERDFQKEDSR